MGGEMDGRGERELEIRRETTEREGQRGWANERESESERGEKGRGRGSGALGRQNRTQCEVEQGRVFNEAVGVGRLHTVFRTEN